MPFPVPGVPKLMVIQLALVVAVREQLPALAVMVIRPSPPEAPHVALFGLMENEQVVWPRAAWAKNKTAKPQRIRRTAGTPIPFGIQAETI